MSASTYSSNDEPNTNEDNSEFKHAPKIIDVISLLSVLLGTFLGIYGLLNRNLATASEQSLIGAVGYFLTIIVPIALLQLIRMLHASALKVDKDGNEIEFLPTEVHVEWEKRKSRLLKIAAMGLASAALSITVFFWPIAQGLA